MIAKCIAAVWCSLSIVGNNSPKVTENVWLNLGERAWKFVLAKNTTYLEVSLAEVHFVLHVDCEDVPDRVRPSAFFAWRGGAQFSAEGWDCHNQPVTADVTFHLRPSVMDTYPSEARAVLLWLLNQRQRKNE